MESGILAKKSYIFLGVYEFLGCMLALVGINCSTNLAEVCAMSIFIAATLTGRVSGGHFNGAVTFAVYLVEGKWKRNLSIAVLIVIVDIMGAFTAMGIAIILLGANGTFTLVPPLLTRNLESLFYLFTVEMFFTFILVSTVLFVKYRSVTSTTDGMLSNMTIALAVFICVKMSSPLSGGGLNPTFATAIILTDAMCYATDQTLNEPNAIFLIAYIFGPLAGGALAAGLLKITLKIAPKVEEEDELTEEEKQAQVEAEQDMDTGYAHYTQTEGARNFSVNMSASNYSKFNKKLTGMNVLSTKDYLM